MPEVTRWVFTVCCGTVLCGILSVLSPGKGSERLMGMVLGLFMLCCFLLPAGMGLDLEPDRWGLEEAASAMESAAGEVERYFLRDTARRAREELERAAAQELAGTGINEEDFQIYIEADDPEGAGLGLRAVVTLPPENEGREKELLGRLEEKLGIPVRLQYKEGL